MFGTKEYICLNNERVVTEQYYYDEQWYDRKSQQMLEWDSLEQAQRDELNQYYENMKTELDISQSIIVNNLLG